MIFTFNHLGPFILFTYGFQPEFLKKDSWLQNSTSLYLRACVCLFVPLSNSIQSDRFPQKLI
jgi:hypothetical protein